MPAIITDQIRILNANNFVSGISTTDNSYYVFIGLPNASEIDADWNTNTPYPIDSIDQYNDMYDTVISAKKVTSSDVLKVVRKVDWESGTIYEMYRQDYSINRTAPQTGATSLYQSKLLYHELRL